MAPVAPEKQQQRKHLTLQEKLEIIELREKRYFKANKSEVAIILKCQGRHCKK